MVILKFNKLIRNKWVWGVFALIVSAAFVAPEGCLYGSDSGRGASAGNKLPEVEYDADLHQQCDYLVRNGFLDFVGMAQLFNPSKADSYWKLYAALKAFDEAGVHISDEYLSVRIKAAFTNKDTQVFDSEYYKDYVEKRLGMSKSQFENYFRLILKFEAGLNAVADGQQGLSSAECDLLSRDFTDKFTVRVATFTEDKAAAAKVTVDDAKMRAWYDKNKNEFALPDRYKVRYIRLNPVASNLLANVVVTDDQIKARYEADKESGLYDFATTNDVIKVKPLEEVRSEIVVALKEEGARTALEEEVYKAMPENEEEDKTAKFLDEFAAKKGVKPQISQWFSLEDRKSIRGFVENVRMILPGIKPEEALEFKRKVGDLKGSDLDWVSTSSSIWIFQLATNGVSKAHTPAFEEVKKLVAPRALNDAKADLFKSTVEAVKAKGYDAVIKSSGAATNVAFNCVDFDPANPPFENAARLLSGILKLQKGEVSDFVLLQPGKAVLVACVDRVEGTAEQKAKGNEYVNSVEKREADTRRILFVNTWLDWNLKRYGYKSASSSNKDEDTQADEEDKKVEAEGKKSDGKDKKAEVTDKEPGKK